MALAHRNSIEIKESTLVDGRKQLAVYTLFIDNARIASVEEQRNGSIVYRFQPVGGFQLQEAQVWIEGLLHLSMKANHLKAINDGKAKRK